MAKKSEKYDIELIMIEKLERGYELTFENGILGKYPIKIEEKYRELFKRGYEYVGCFDTSDGLSDFIGDDEVVTCNFNLEKIIKDEEIIWKK